MTNQTLSKLVKNLLKEQEEISAPNYQTLVDQLKAMIVSGAIDKEDINAITDQLHRARINKGNKRSPESYKAAAEKAKATRAQSAIDVAKFMADDEESEQEEEKARLARKAAGKLPLTADSHFGKVDPKYYDFDYNSGGSAVYRLKPEFV